MYLLHETSLALAEGNLTSALVVNKFNLDLPSASLFLLTGIAGSLGGILIVMLVLLIGVRFRVGRLKFQRRVRHLEMNGILD